MRISRLENTVVECLAKRTAARHGFKVKFFDSWKPELDEALRYIPEDNICPHELFTLLCRNPGSTAKKIVLLKEGDIPIAVACFRRMSKRWVPVTNYVVPGFLFPVKEGYIGRTLEAVGLDVHVAWWRWNIPPPESSMIKDIHAAPTRGIRLSDDFEEYWREKGQFKNIRKYRNRCKSFDFRVNFPGMTEWTIKNWAERWCPEEMTEMPDLHERLIVGGYLEKHGLCHTLALFDKGEPVASAILLAHHKDAVAYVNYRRPEYDWNGAMNRLIDMCFHWAREKGFENIDIGGSQDYKDRWAPENGTKWEFRVCPDFISKFSRAKSIVRTGWSTIIGQSVRPRPDKSCASDIRSN